MQSNKKLQVKSGFKSSFDPNGSYTGVPEDENERPIQDADDL